MTGQPAPATRPDWWSPRHIARRSAMRAVLQIPGAARERALQPPGQGASIVQCSISPGDTRPDRSLSGGLVIQAQSQGHDTA
jgi:hypothetical protein